MDDVVVWLDSVEPAQAVAVAGSKMGRLTELRETGVVVPDGFTVSIDAYRQHVELSGLDEFIDELLTPLGADPTLDSVERAGERIRAEFEERPVTPEIADEIAEAYEQLCSRASEVNMPVAVRSSATGEDSGDASFAGIFDTYLGITGTRRVVDAVRTCWGSLFTGRALDYRLRRKISHLDMPIAVGVLQLVQARSSGVAFSVHPVTGKADRIVIEANWGWGEAVVQGLVTPDHIEVGKSDHRVLRHTVADKAVVSMFDFSIGQVVEMEMPAKFASQQVLDEEQVEAIVKAVVTIEEHYGYPVDVEWVIDRYRRPGDSVPIVQARPVTVKAEVPASISTWNPAAMAAKYAFHTDH